MKSDPPIDTSADGATSGDDAPSARPRVDLQRRRRAREFFLALGRGIALGHCRSCETFYLMAKLCRDECSEDLAPSELGDLGSWVEGGKLVELGFGCEGACGIVGAYSRIAE